MGTFSSYGSQTGANQATGDLYLTDDISDTTQGASGTVKKITLAETANGLIALAANTFFPVDVTEGTSTSGTATTQVAQIAAAAGHQLVAWTIFAAQTNAASTQMKIIITYSDSTTTTDTSAAATATTMMANAGGIIRTAAGAEVAATAASAKKVTTLRVETAGTGTGTRAAVISAIEIPQ